MTTWTLAQRNSLAAAIAEGALSVQYEDRRVTYRSQEDMLALLARMDRELGLVDPAAANTVVGRFDKDL